MKGDWIWGWIVGVPTFVISMMAFGWSGLALSFVEHLALSLVLAAAIGSGIASLKNRASIRRLKARGGEIEWMIRPKDALLKSLARSTFAIPLVYMLWTEQVPVGVGCIVLAPVIALVWIFSLRSTNYKRPV